MIFLFSRRLKYVDLFFILFLIVLLLPAHVAHAQEWTISDIETFIENSLPEIDGSVVSKQSENIYVELEDSRSFPSRPVQVFRRVVSEQDDEKQLNRQIIGTATLSKQEGQLAQLQAKDELSGKINVGDRIRTSKFILFIDDQTETWTQNWNESISSMDGVRAVRSGDPSASTDKSSSHLLLMVEEDKLTLKKPGEWGAIATRKRDEQPTDNTAESTQTRKPTGPDLEKVARVNKVLNDMSHVPLPGYPNVQILQLASRHSVGFSRWKGKIASLSWHDIRGEVLSISPLPDRMDGLESFPFILVRKEDGTVFTHYYEFNLGRRKMRRRWTARHTWIEKLGDRLYGWKVGLNEPFSNRGHPVEVNDQDWEWHNNQKPKIPSLSVPSGVSSLNKLVFRINKNGKIDIFKHGEKTHTSSQVYGGHPISVSARRSKISMDRHPEFVTWNSKQGNIRVLVGNNQTKGVPFFKGLQSFDESRLYLLSRTEGYLKTIWESNRLPGYIAGIHSGDGNPWVVSVEPSRKVTFIRALTNVNFSASPESFSAERKSSSRPRERNTDSEESDWFDDWF